MKRIIKVLVVSALMVVLTAITVSPAFANPGGNGIGYGPAYGPGNGYGDECSPCGWPTYKKR
jgi:hypothetical protein